MYTSNQLSALFNINIQTLYYYDSIGLLTPTERNFNGKRIYSSEKCYILARILYLKTLGHSLNEIKSIIYSESYIETLNHIKARTISLRQKWQNLKKQENLLKNKANFIEKHLSEYREDIFYREMDSINFFEIGSEQKLFQHDLFYLNPTIVFHDINFIKTFGVIIEKSKSKKQKTSSGKYLCKYHKGPYYNIPKSINGIENFAKNNNVDIDQKSRFTINILDQFLESNSKNFITLIFIKVQ